MMKIKVKLIFIQFCRFICYVFFSSSPQNTLFLELHCPAVQPPLVVISNNGQNAIDFQQVAVGPL